ncbi:helix-turn-helix domain-containing protein [Fodinicola acaciae]|uniref:helix-turn-helix domain-containing protein n=1 Tax=Fodinicola acaciae TaxID=2681555 RepID=UPI0013D41E63|nr:helix-turn-helix transcriptional regulator [Fodinicola acaciae]
MSAELRRLRRTAGFTSVQVARELGMSQSKISRIETGRCGLELEEVVLLLGHYSCPRGKRTEIIDLVRKAADPGLIESHVGRLPDQWQAFIEHEARATALWSYQPLWIPGLLQTADYARAVIAGANERPLPEKDVETRVAARLARQAILRRPLPPELHFLLFEPALRVPVGGRQVLGTQLWHLAQIARRPRVHIRVVPLAVGAHPGLEGPFVIMAFEASPTLVHLENRVLSAFLEKEGEIASYRLAWDRIAAKALSAERSVEVIRRVAAQLTSRTEE